VSISTHFSYPSLRTGSETALLMPTQPSLAGRKDLRIRAPPSLCEPRLHALLRPALPPNGLSLYARWLFLRSELRRTPYLRSSQILSSSHSGGASSTMSHPPKSRHIGQSFHTRGSAYATCCALQPFAAHRRKGRGLGTVSYC